jgi:hypothetical protein
MTEVKVCPQCKREVPVAEWPVSLRSPHGPTKWCVICLHKARERVHKSNAANPERRKERRSQWYKENADMRREKNRRWRENNPDRHLERSREYYYRNREKVLEKMRERRKAARLNATRQADAALRSAACLPQTQTTLAHCEEQWMAESRRIHESFVKELRAAGNLRLVAEIEAAWNRSLSLFTSGDRVDVPSAPAPAMEPLTVMRLVNSRDRIALNESNPEVHSPRPDKPKSRGSWNWLRSPIAAVKSLLNIREATDESPISPQDNPQHTEETLTRRLARYWANPEQARNDRRRYYRENRDRELERGRKYRAQNPETMKRARRKWSEDNPDRVREHRRKWYAKNREVIRERRRQARLARKAQLATALEGGQYEQ